MQLLRISRKRRRKQIYRITIMAFLISVFVCASILYHSQMSAYQRQADYKNYGKWFLCSEKGGIAPSHPYLEQAGDAISGIGIYDEQEETGYYAGWLSKDVCDMGNIVMYEGRMPEKPDEIAMELSVLERLGYSYELGQKITLTYGKYYDVAKRRAKHKSQEYSNHTYTLVGTIQNYTARWSCGGYMPNAILNEAGIGDLDCEYKTYTFQSLKPEYKNIDANEFYNALLEKYSSESSGDIIMFYNSFVYEHEIWGSKEVGRNILYVIVIMGSCAMVYLIASYQKKRRGFYYRLRCIGASKWQIHKMAVYEMLITVLPAGILGIILSYAVCMGIIVIIASTHAYEYFFAFHFVEFAEILCAVFGTFAISISISQCFLKSNHVYEGQISIGQKTKRRIAKDSQKNRHIGIRMLVKRKNMLHPFQNTCIKIVGISVCVISFCCMAQITHEYSIYQIERADYYDVSLEAPREQKDIEYISTNSSDFKCSVGIEFKTMKSCISEKTKKSIEQLPEVADVFYTTIDNSHNISWEGKEKSPYRGWYQRTYMDDMPEDKREEYETYQLYCTTYYHDAGKVWADFKEQITWEGADYEKFLNGEQILLCLSFGDDSDPQAIIASENGLQPGKSIKISTKNGDVEAEIAGIVYSNKILAGLQYGWWNSFCYLGSEALGQKVAEQDGISWGYNEAGITLKQNTDKQAVAKQLSVMAVRDSLIFDTDFEMLENTYHKLVQTGVLYGSLSLMLIIVFMLIRGYMLKDLYQSERKSYMRLHHMGLSGKSICRMAVWRGIKEGMFYLWSVPAALCILAYGLWRENTDNIIMTVSYRLGLLIPYTTKANYVAYEILDKVSIGLWGSVILLLIICLGTLHLLFARKCYQSYKEEIDG